MYNTNMAIQKAGDFYADHTGYKEQHSNLYSAPQPDRHVKAAIRRLKRDLTAQNAAAGDDDFFDFHIDPVLHDNFLLL